MIQMKEFSFQYESGKKPALKDINLEIRPGDFVGIIGNSGAARVP